MRALASFYASGIDSFQLYPCQIVLHNILYDGLFFPDLFFSMVINSHTRIYVYIADVVAYKRQQKFKKEKVWGVRETRQS